MAYGDFRDLPRRTAMIKDYVMKHLTLLKMQNMMHIKKVLLQWVIKFLIRNLLVLIFQIVLLKLKLCETNN